MSIEHTRYGLNKSRRGRRAFFRSVVFESTIFSSPKNQVVDVDLMHRYSISLAYSSAVLLQGREPVRGLLDCGGPSHMRPAIGAVQSNCCAIETVSLSRWTPQSRLAALCNGHDLGIAWVLAPLIWVGT